MTEEEVRAVAKISGGKMGTYTYADWNEGKYTHRWHCSLYIPPKEFVGDGDDKEEAINNAWEEYVNNTRDQCIS